MGAPGFHEGRRSGSPSGARACRERLPEADQGRRVTEVRGVNTSAAEYVLERTDQERRPQEVVAAICMRPPRILIASASTTDGPAQCRGRRTRRLDAPILVEHRQARRCCRGTAPAQPLARTGARSNKSYPPQGHPCRVGDGRGFSQRSTPPVSASASAPDFSFAS